MADGLDSQGTVALLRRVGLRELMGSDGCLCGYVEIRGVHIDRSCHKSESSLRVYQNGDRYSLGDLALVAAEALRQMREEDSWSDILVRYCAYDHDHDGSGYIDTVWVRGPGKCVYCGMPRADRDDYLCARCIRGEVVPGYPIAARYDFASLLPHGLQPARSTTEGNDNGSR